MAALIALALPGGSERYSADAEASPAGVYVAQTVAGSGDGTSCANAKPASFFNVGAHWGVGHPIAPGTVVHLCGTITSTLTAQGDGTAGNPVTIRFEPGAKLSQPVCNCLVLNNRSFIVVDGGTNGVIESTDNGTDLGHQSNATAIYADPCDNCEIEHLTIRNIYVHTGTRSEIDQTQMRAIYFSGSNFLFHDNTVHDAGWAIFDNSNAGDTGIHVYRNNIYNVDHGFIQSGGNVGNIWFNNNHVHDLANWDTDNNAYHHDGVHCYTVNGGTPKHIDNFYIYDNVFDGSVGGNATAWIFMEGAPRHDSYDTPCADATSNIWVFNNFAHTDHNLVNGVFNLATGRNFVYNNTLVGNNTSAAGLPQIVLSAGGGPGELENNVLSTGNQVPNFDADTFPPDARDYNIYANSGDNWYCNGFLNTYQAWRACEAGDAHSSYVQSASLDAQGRPNPGSPALGAGTNLSALCTGSLAPLCYDIRGALRPLRMAPDVGAYQRETAAITTKSVGAARLGEPQSSIESFYGRARRGHRTGLLDVFDIHGTVTASYRLHGGLLRISYRAGKAVAISTTTPYYTTRAGFGVGAAADAKMIGGGWSRCGAVLVRRRAGTATAIRVFGGKVAALALAPSATILCR